MKEQKNFYRNTIILLMSIFLLQTFVCQIVRVSGTSMENTFKNGNLLLVNKLAYKTEEPERFDVVIFPYENTYFIKRIIGLPGEKIEIKEDGSIYINGAEIDHKYLKESIDLELVEIERNSVTLGENEYFVMGDNANNSLDSRFESVGNVKKEDIVGKIFFQLTPIWNIKIVR